MERKSNRTTAREAAARLRSLIEESEGQGRMLPVKKGALWHAEIKRQAGLTNGQIDGNSAIREMLVEHANKHGIAFSRRGLVAPEEDAAMPPDDHCELVPAARLREAQLRLAQMERKAAELRAENASLRAEIQRNSEVVELIALGGRITSGPK
ncbi:hypothetical protein PVV74_17530 [Roseovarius sp. SK2]|uniref:hypothetical protein n=1 Tax=Roseovarius TaxID=74030 RepID=UPI00237BD5EF|nr:hypothetical protein [Roseovarius sp. SK2]MDD9727264.1 hypothetical protein [Roseovarius sp. SK2]